MKTEARDEAKQNALNALEKGKITKKQYEQDSSPTFSMILRHTLI
jgi:hypothetical protein